MHGCQNRRGKGGTEQTRSGSFLQNNIQKINIEILAILYILSSFYYDNTGYEFFMRGIQIKYISTLKWTYSKNFVDGDFKVLLLIIHFHCEPRLLFALHNCIQACRKGQKSAKIWGGSCPPAPPLPSDMPGIFFCYPYRMARKSWKCIEKWKIAD